MTIEPQQSVPTSILLCKVLLTFLPVWYTVSTIHIASKMNSDPRVLSRDVQTVCRYPSLFKCINKARPMADTNRNAELQPSWMAIAESEMQCQLLPICRHPCVVPARRFPGISFDTMLLMLGTSSGRMSLPLPAADPILLMISCRER